MIAGCWHNATRMAAKLPTLTSARAPLTVITPSCSSAVVHVCVVCGVLCRFPNGFKAVADYIHSLGLKSGLYTAKGPNTCAGVAASCDHEYQDAAQWASWGIECVTCDLVLAACEHAGVCHRCCVILAAT